MIAEVIHDDTGLPDEQSRCSRCRWWEWPRSPHGSGWTPTAHHQQDAANLVSSLAWRGIRGFPRTEEQA